MKRLIQWLAAFIGIAWCDRCHERIGFFERSYYLRSGMQWGRFCVDCWVDWKSTP